MTKAAVRARKGAFKDLNLSVGGRELGDPLVLGCS